MTTATSRDTMPDQVGMTKPPMGKAVIPALGTVNVPCPSITATSLVFLSVLSGSGTLNLSSGLTINAGVGFSLTSAALAATTIAWMVLEP